ncbi:MAG: hypothetical protein KUG71_08400 [Porticoccaceae bacterium]|nr:hypothetical protein [Porticoccaceae bacterium]
MELPEGAYMKLSPEDEYMHPLGEAENFNESMYFNVYDPDGKVGGWFRIGNRANEGYAEMTTCIYLPDGSVAFMFQRANISNNDAFKAGGMEFIVDEPYKTLTVKYSGEVLVLKNPHGMTNPSKAFKNNPKLPCTVELNYRGVSPMYGGEPTLADGSLWQDNPNNGLYVGHYEQHIAGTGTFVIGDQTYTIKGLGLRDHSWGPRYWQNVQFYRWLPMNFTEDFAIMCLNKTSADGTKIVGGMVLNGDRYDLIREARIETQWDENYYQTSLKAWAKTDHAEYEIEGRVMSLIPLRNRRTLEDGTELMTRITEGMTEYRCNGMVGYGLSEYLDQIIDGKPNGIES